MSVIVSKFGGSSTANAECFRRIMEIVEQSPDRRYIILSAPGTDQKTSEKITALLLKCWQSRHDGARLRILIEHIAQRFYDIAGALGVPDAADGAADEIAQAVMISEAHIASRGEYLCAKLFSAWSGIPMADAAEIIRFDSNGQLDCKETHLRFSLAAAMYPRLIIPGFYGSMPDGGVVTFPRNGSDITGALAAAGMDAGLYENWTDVPGLMTADPAVVPDARLIRQISYRQMRQLARAGAQVLHPACLDPVAMAGIPTRLRCTMRPESFGTLIDDNCAGTAACVAGRKTGDTACISAFGLTRGKRTRAAQALPHAVVAEESDYTRFIVGEAEYETAVRTLHDILMA